MKLTIGSCGGWILPAVFMGIVIVSSGVGVSHTITEHAFLAKAELDDGTITDYQVDSSGKSVIFCPIIDFKTKAGEPQEYEGSDCQNHPQQIIIGKPVQVWFDPQEPHVFQTFRGSAFAAYLDVADPFFLALLFLFIAGVFIAINLGQAVGARRRQNSATAMAPQFAAYQPPAPPASRSGGETEANLLAEQARLQAAEAEVQRKLAERRQQGQ